MSEYLLAMTTVEDRESAESLASALVQAGCAACVSIVPGVTSVYRWQGKIEQETEQTLLIKTSQAAWDTLAEHIRREHPYELPELIAVPIQAGSTEYLAWVAENLNP